MKTHLNTVRRNNLNLTGLTSMPPQEHQFSRLTRDFLRDTVGPLAHSLDLSIEPEVQHGESGRIVVMYGGFRKLIDDICARMPQLSQQDLEVILRDILFFPSLTDTRMRIGYQALMVTILRKYASKEMNQKGLYRVVSLLSFCSQVDYEDKVRIGSPRRIDRIRVEHTKATIEYNLRDLIYVCYPELSFADDDIIKTLELEELLTSDPYCLFLLPPEVLDPDDSRMFLAFEKIIAYSGVQFGDIWIKNWLVGEHFHPFWIKMFQSGKNDELLIHMFSYPKCPERRHLEELLGTETVKTIVETGPQAHHTVSVVKDRVNGTIMHADRTGSRSGDSILKKVKEEERRFRRLQAKKGTKDAATNSGAPKISVPSQKRGKDIPANSHGNMTVLPGNATGKKPDIVGGVQKNIAKILVPEQPRQRPVKIFQDTVNFWLQVLEEGRYASAIRDGVVMLHLQGSFGHRLHDRSFSTITIDASGNMTPDIGQGDLSSKIDEIVHVLRQKHREEEQKKKAEKAERDLEATKMLWGLAIADGDYSYEIGEEGMVLFTLSPQLLDLIHDEKFGTISVAQNGSMSHSLIPEIETQLQILAAEKREQQNKKTQQAQDDAERKKIGEELRPIYDIIEGDLGITEKTLEPTEVNQALSKYGALIVLARDRSVMWLKLPNGIEIKYFSGGNCHLLLKGNVLSPIRKECYLELGEALDRIGRILCEKSEKTRKTRITEMNSRRDSVDALFARIREGRAYTLLTDDSSYLQGGEFPRSQVSGMVQKFDGRLLHPDKEKSTHIILSADSLTFTGRLADSLLNGLADSPWGRQILWERICATRNDITLGDALIYTQELRGEITGRAGELLNSDSLVWRGDKEKFLDEYVDLLAANKIHVYYAPFVAMKWSEYLREVERRQLKQSEEEMIIPTAD